MRKFLFLVAMLVAALGAQAQAPKFIDPDRIKYDGQCFRINGKDTFIYSGAFHYFRCPQPLWADRFRKIKAAGFNTVETYVPWNYHEQEEPSGLDDFSKIHLRECQEWIMMAMNQFGLNVIVRPGPYICAEWDGGGYPQWLLKHKPESVKSGWLRSNEPTYLAWSRHWIRAVCRALERFQITRQPEGKPGIIMFQLENEYDYNQAPDEVHIGQLKALEQQAIDGGIEVPFVTCWTKQIRGSKDPILSQVFDCCNFYPRWDVKGIESDLTKIKVQQPKAPSMVMELQGGWFSENGGLLAEDQEGITAAQINNLTLFCIQNGVAALNYYMLFGGTNFGDRTPPNITSSYDYFAPIREDGALGEKYRAVSAIGAMLKEYGPRFARSTGFTADAKTSDPSVQVTLRFDTTGGRILFVRNSSRTEPKSGEAAIAGLTFHYDLGPFGSKILYLAKEVKDADQGVWLPKPVPQLPKPETVSTMRIATAMRRFEDGGSMDKPALIGQPLYQQDDFDSQYVVYRGGFDSESTVDQTLSVSTLGEQDFVVRFNGKLVEPFKTDGKLKQFQLVGVQRKGNVVEILLENPGFPNWEDMDAPRGLKGVELQPLSLVAGKTTVARPLKMNWTNRTDGVKNHWFSLMDINEEPWESVWLDAGTTIKRKVSAKDPVKGGNHSDHLMTWYAMAFDLPDKSAHESTRRILVDTVGNGFLYVNGHQIGRIWQKGPQREYYIPECWLKFGGSNQITVSLRPVDGVEALKAVEIGSYLDRTTE